MALRSELIIMLNKLWTIPCMVLPLSAGAFRRQTQVASNRLKHEVRYDYSRDGALRRGCSARGSLFRRRRL